MNYKNACLKQTSVVKQVVKAKKVIATDENAKFNRSCEKAVRILYLRWTKYKQDYIALHGEDEYERMYLTPNYWVMPEDDEPYESDKEKEEEYYSDYSSS